MVWSYTLSRWRLPLSGIAAAMVLVFLAVTPGGRTAVAQFLSQFRSQRFAVVTFDPGQMGNSLLELERLGTFHDGQTVGRPVQVSSAAEARKRTGIPVKQPDPATLPADFHDSPTITVWTGHEMRFTFDKAKADRYFREIGRPDVTLPENFDGATLVVAVPPAVLIQYRGADNSKVLMVGQASELTAGLEGKATLDELREALLNMPGIPPDVTRQLRAIQDWRNTLPVPVPVDRVRWQQTTIAGAPGLLLGDNSGLGSVAIWHRDGRIYGVAGTASTAEVLRVAENLR